MAVNLLVTVLSIMASRLRRAIALGILLTAIPLAALAQTGTIAVSNGTPVVGTAVTFTVNVTVPTGVPPATTLFFGDSSALAALSPPYPVAVSR